MNDWDTELVRARNTVGLHMPWVRMCTRLDAAPIPENDVYDY